MGNNKYIEFAEWLAENHYRLIKVSKEEKIWSSPSDTIEELDIEIERTTDELYLIWKAIQ